MLLRGLQGRYVRELEVLASLGYNDVYIQDRIEAYRSARTDSVSARWDVDQFTLPRDRAAIDLHLSAPMSRLDYPMALRYVDGYFRQTLEFDEGIEVGGGASIIEAFGEAFARSRQSQSDYFIIASLQQQGRTVQVDASLFASGAGIELGSYTVIDGSPNRLHNAIFTVGARIAADIPRQGRVIDIRGRMALADIGAVHGVNVGDRLPVIRREQLRAAPDALAMLYDENDLLGQFVVIRIDDLISEGVLERNGFFDQFELGDHVLFEQDTGPSDRSDKIELSPVYQQIRAIR